VITGWSVERSTYLTDQFNDWKVSSGTDALGQVAVGFDGDSIAIFVRPIDLD
jgi:hypothetical protein